jgi:mannose-6-phosphate isomerase-like protein (cupin superfamily)
MGLKGFRIRLKDVPEVATPSQISLKIPVHPDVTGAPLEASLSFFVITFPPGSTAPSHSHKSDEYEYVLSGTGLLDAGDEKGIPLEPDMVAYNPKGITHKITNTGKVPLKILKVHVPPITPFGQDDIFTAKAINEAKKAFKQ